MTITVSDPDFIVFESDLKSSRSGRIKAHKHELFALVNVQMALGQTAGSPRVIVYVFASKRRKHKLFPLVNRRVVPGLSRLSKSLCVQSLCAFLLPYSLQTVICMSGSMLAGVCPDPEGKRESPSEEGTVEQVRRRPTESSPFAIAYLPKLYPSAQENYRMENIFSVFI